MTLHCTIHVASRGNRFMLDLADLYAGGLRDRGVDVRMGIDELPAGDRNRVDLIVAPHEFFTVGPSMSQHDGEEVLRRCALLTTEQPGTPWFDLELHLARLAAATLDLSHIGAEALRSAGIPSAVQAPVGYHRSIDAFAGDWDRERPHDVTFLGGATPRRLSALSRCTDVLHHRDSRLLLHDPARPVVRESPWFVTGPRRAALLADSKVLLNVHRDDRPYLEWVRVIEAICNGAAVLTEVSDGCAPLEPFDHFLPAPIEDLPAYLSGLLADDELRLEMARRAYDFVRTELRLEDHLGPLVDALTLLASKHTAWVAVELPPRADPAPFAAPVRSEGDEVRQVLKSLLVGQISLRRQMEELTSLVRHGDPDAFDESATPGWHRCRPDVSVVVPAYRYRDHVCEAVESALASEEVSLEVIVLDDHSDDGTREVLEEFLAGHPDAPVSVLYRVTNRGLGAARNLGFERARSDRCFLLDADNLLRPSALRKLSAALDEDERAAFAYSIIEVFGDDRTLLSYLPWSVEQLVQDPYIDAMALVRTSAWRAVGGFREATEATIYGWEDYAFWLAMADEGLGGTLVPEPLCRYRRHVGSMASVTNLDPFLPMSHLRRAYPRLPWPG